MRISSQYPAKRISIIRPGVTGRGQISERNRCSKTDLGIMLMTTVVVFRGTGYRRPIGTWQRRTAWETRTGLPLSGCDLLRQRDVSPTPTKGHILFPSGGKPGGDRVRHSNSLNYRCLLPDGSSPGACRATCGSRSDAWPWVWSGRQAGPSRARSRRGGRPSCSRRDRRLHLACQA
jgi:hypothetical protein